MENSEETSYIPNRSTRPKHSRSVSTVPKQNNNNNNVISSMPKLLIKNLRKKKYHRRQVSITFPSRINPENTDTKKTRKNNHLMQFIPSAKNVGSVMSYLFRNNKKTKKSQDNHGLGKPGSVSVQCSTPSISTLFRDNNNKKKKNGLKSVKGKEECVKGKSGLIIRGLTKIRSRETERFELCKKKILMGEKCWPLHGVPLRYDKNGVLVPDEDLAT